MDPEVSDQVCHTISACYQWQDDHSEESNAVGFEFVEATETTLTFSAKGMLFQLLLPTVPPEPDEIFIAMNLDNSVPNSLLVAINEKLERLKVGPRALEQALSVFARAMVSFEGKRKRVTAESVRLVEFEENLLKDDSDAELDMDDGDDEDTSSRGFLFVVTKEASERCRAARCRNVKTFLLCIPVQPIFLGPSAITYMDDILQFCNVSTVSALNQVRIQAEVAGFVNDMKTASSLGLPCSKSLQILMEFDELFWGERGSGRPLALKRVAVGLGLEKGCETGLVDASEVPSDEEFEAECKQYAGRQKTVAYGTSVLLPELIQTFFRYRCGEKDVSKLRSKPWDNVSLDEALQYFTAIDNPFVGLICFIGCQLRSLPSWCAVCWSLLPASVWRLRTCRHDLCLYDFEELGLGAAIHHEIQESPEVVELELFLACAAASSARDVFEPFPQAFLQGKELRDRSGWFSSRVTTKQTVGTTSRGAPIGYNSVGRFSPYSPTTVMATSQTMVATSRTVVATSQTVDTSQQNSGDAKDGADLASKSTVEFKEMQNKELSLLLEILQSIPSIADLQESTDECSLKRKLSKVVFSAWRKKDAQKRSEKCKMWLAYDLMRFIVSTNRLSLRVMKGNDELGLSLKLKFQFVVLHDSPEKEAIFEERRIRRGSSFYFHGSPNCNWYSILRNGLRPMSNTKFMSSGAAYGSGIYLSDNFSLAYGYARGQHGSWKNGSLKEGMTVVAICEVVTPLPTSAPTRHGALSGHHRASSIYVVPPGQEDDVSVRYLLVMDNSCELSPHSIVINGCTLQGSSPPMDLREKYENLKCGDHTQQQMDLLERRSEAFLRVKGDVTDPKLSKAECADGKLPTPAITEPRVGLFSESEPESSPSPSPSSKRADNHTARQSHAVPMPNSKRLKEKNGANTGAPLTATATQAITKEFRNVQSEIRKARKGTSSNGPRTESFLSYVTVDMPDETNLCVWNVNLAQHLFKSYHLLYKDLEILAAKNLQPESSVLLEVTFPGMYPFEPPFVRVVRPRFLFHTGHVTVGGSICMELLTTTGWLPSFSFESVLVQVVNAFVQGEGRIDMKAVGRDYSKEEAQSAFTRVAAQHGWTAPGSRN